MSAPTPSLPAIRIAGGCYAFTRNKAFYFKGLVTAEPKRTTFNVETNQHGVIEHREQDFTYEIKGTPAGRLDALSVLWPYGACAVGELVHAVTKLVSINAGTDVATFTSLARFRNGAPVMPGAVGTGVLPGGLTQTIFYLHIISGTTGTFHTTEAAAIAGTSPVDLTGSVTGECRIIEQEYLNLIDYQGNQYQFFNVAVVGLPNINGSAAKSPIGEVTFEAFRQFGIAPTNAASFYTKTTGVTLDTSFDPSAIVTEAFNMSWGVTAPWAAMATRDGIEMSFPLSLDPLGDDVIGVQSRIIKYADAQLSAMPIGISEDDVYAKLVAQGSGAGRGRRIVGTDNLDITSTTTNSLFARLYAAALQPSAQNYDPAADRAGRLTWKPNRSYTAGVANALYYVGPSFIA